jgi:hypothetical protein
MKVKETLAASCAGIRDAELKVRLLSREADLTAAEEIYAAAGANGGLFALARTAQDTERRDPDIDGNDLRKLYEKGLVRRMDGRIKYDQLKARAPFGRCLLCGNGEVGALDHHLPKDSLPLYTICPENLVPACGTCNLAKGNRIGSSPGKRTLHPYYDRPGAAGRYLVAEVLSQAVQFRIQPLPEWDDELRERVDHHFRTFDLANRYAQFAISPLIAYQWLHQSIWRQGGPKGLAAHLQEAAAQHALTHGLNMWDTALLYGLADSDWYLNGGVNQDY